MFQVQRGPPGPDGRARQPGAVQDEQVAAAEAGRHLGGRRRRDGVAAVPPGLHRDCDEGLN